ncbi:MAG TPA: GDSL-type esterase/lipase family protein [Methylomirabilota bacterium]|jgi:acyl-CoA thioesterase-1
MGWRRGVLFLLVAVLLIGGGWALWPRAARRSPGAGAPPVGPTVVFLGDSITSGHRLPAEAAFPHRLGQALGIPVVNAGISGDTTEGGLSRLDRDVLAHRPRVVVVELGVNDVFGRWPRERTVANLRTITQRLRAQGAGVILVHITLPGVPGDGHRRHLREIARAEGATLVEDFLDGVVPGHSYDGLHPDEQGQAMLAERLLPVLREALDR